MVPSTSTLKRSDRPGYSHHQDQDFQRRQEEGLREAEWEARDRERELESDRRDRDRDSERNRRQCEREHTQKLIERGRPLIGSSQNSARSRCANLAIATSLRALRDQVREITATIQRACKEEIVLRQSDAVCRRRRLSCLRCFACRTALRCDGHHNKSTPTGRAMILFKANVRVTVSCLFIGSNSKDRQM